MNLRELLKSFGEGKVYYPQLAQKIGGVSAAILFLTLWRWLKNDSTGQCSLPELRNATGLTETEEKLAQEALKDRSLLTFQFIDSDVPILSYQLYLEQLELILAEDTPSETKTSLPQPQSDPYFPPRRRSISVSVTPHYQFSGPWNSKQQLEGFQDALLDYAKQQGYSHPSGWVFKVIDSISKGIKSPFWEEFISGQSLGESQQIQQEWEIQPGVAYPAFESERVQYYVHKGEPLEAAVEKARSDLRNPVKARDLWEGFLRKCDRLADEALKAKKTGVQHPYLPPSFREQVTVTKESVMTKLSQLEVNSPILEEEKPPEKTLAKEQESDIPHLEDLQNLYRSPMTRKLIEEQIAKHPEWGYEIINDRVVDKYPF